MVSSRSSGLTGVNNDEAASHNNNENNNGISEEVEIRAGYCSVTDNKVDQHDSPVAISSCSSSCDNSSEAGASTFQTDDTGAKGTITPGGRIDLRINDNKNAKLSFGANKKQRRNDDDDDDDDERQQVSILLSRNKTHNQQSVPSDRNKADYPDEERYEGFGYAQSATVGGIDEEDLEIEIEPSERDTEDSSAPSPTGPNSLSLKSNSPCSTIGRHSWLRTSLRRTSPSTARQQRQLGSNALASQLYRSGSFNSSGRGSTCDAADDMYSDVSLEDDVIDLNHRVRMIQEQMHVLNDTHSVGEERYARAKQENATLQARILMLEEAAKDAESRAEEKLEIEQRRHREWACRLEREKQLQLENYAIKMQTHELECASLRDQVGRLREQLDTAREDRGRMENVIQDLRRDITEVREAERQALLRCNEARVLLDAAKEELAMRADDRIKYNELELQVTQLRARNKNLEESRDELQAAAALHAGRELLMLNNLPRPGYDTLDATDQGGACSLAVELSADAIRDLNTMARTAKEPLTIPEMRQALKEQQEVNAQLRSYIDNILLSIVENYPQLLEVKQANG